MVFFDEKVPWLDIAMNNKQLRMKIVEALKQLKLMFEVQLFECKRAVLGSVYGDNK